MVKNWATSPNVGNEPYVVVQNPTAALNKIWSVPGVEGQGVDTPGAKMFYSHFVVAWENYVFDPSYGIGGHLFPMTENSSGKKICVAHESAALGGLILPGNSPIKVHLPDVAQQHLTYDVQSW